MHQLRSAGVLDVLPQFGLERETQFNPNLSVPSLRCHMEECCWLMRRVRDGGVGIIYFNFVSISNY